MKDKNSYQTVFKNEKSVPHEVRGLESQNIRLILPPGAERTLLSPTSYDTYSRYTKIVYLPNGEVKLKVRRGWLEPPHNFPCVQFINLSGHECELIPLSQNKTLYLPKGIPIFSSVSPFSQYSEFPRWAIGEKKLNRNDPRNLNLLVEVSEVHFYPEGKWSAEELEKLNELRKSLIEEERRQRGLG